MPQVGIYNYSYSNSPTHTLRYNGHFPGEPTLAGCPLNSPSPSTLELRILLGHA